MNHVWSYTSLDTFESCPRKFYHRYVLKEIEPKSAAMEEGNKFDAAVEARIKGDAPLPPEYQQYDTFAESLARMKGPCRVYTQLKMGIDTQFEACGFFGPDVWGRGVLDVALVSKVGGTALIVDWKTGKNSENKDYYTGLQLKIFALLIFKHFAKVQKVTGFNLWVKTREIGKPLVFTRADEANLWREVLPRVMKIEDAFAKNKWDERAGPLCAYCAVKICPNNRT